MKLPFGIETKSESLSSEEVQEEPGENKKSSFFSSLAARLFFFLLLLADLLWLCYGLVLFLLSCIGCLITLSKVKACAELRANALITLRRALVCGVSLIIALFSPAFGIMIACTYFLMYDRGGIEEVVPSSLQTQFKEFLHKE
ncbi:MAG TPA: hypothetical protein VGJ00_09065 [Rhabdochlamydiaceae bacterium]|jgi:hypothetical protein